MITNFHLPKSTLLMLVSAFHGKEKIFGCYEHAIRKKYRFFLMAIVVFSQERIINNLSNYFNYKLISKDKDARLGKLFTAHGEIDTLFLCL